MCIQRRNEVSNPLTYPSSGVDKDHKAPVSGRFEH
jgi:hypothetical protein